MRKELLFILVGLLFLSSCTSTHVYLMDPSVKYNPTTHVELYSEPPQKPYKKIATIETKVTSGVLSFKSSPNDPGVPIHTFDKDLPESIKIKAAEVGADGVIITGKSSYNYGNNSNSRIIHGIAIKFIDQEIKR